MTDNNKPSNILFVMTDQQRVDSIGAYGNDWVETPTLDSLACNGLRFDQAYTPTAICAPARASVFTGVRPHRHGLQRNTAQSSIAEEWPCYPPALHSAGYNVGHAGKMHIGQGPDAFDMDGEHLPGWYYPAENEAYQAYLDDRELPPLSADRIRDPFPENGREYQSGGIDDRPEEASFTYFITEQAREQLEEYATTNDPFYMGVNYFGPHNPYYLPEEYATYYDPDEMAIPDSAIKETFDHKPWVHRVQAEKSGLRNLPIEDWQRIIAAYHGWVTFIDQEIGRLLNHLERLGLRDDTLVVFTSDHGSFLTRHKMHDKGPAMYEDIYHIPLIIDGLDLKSSSVSDSFVSLLDIAPTILDTAGIAIPNEYDGQSLYRLDDDEWRETITAEFHGHFFAYEQRMIRDNRYKLVYNEHDIPELYDLKNDPNELVNRMFDPKYGDIAADLYTRLKERLNDRGDGFLEGPENKLSRTDDVGIGQYRP